MSDDTQINEAPEAAPEQTPVDPTPAPKPQKAKAPKVAAPVENHAQVEQPKQDPMVSQLVAAQRELEAARKELESHRQRVKQFERDSKKQNLLGALFEEFPGLPRSEIRGALLVAAEDGHLDPFADDHKAALDHLKEQLRPKSKKPVPAATPSLGGTPGTPSKPPIPGRKFLI